MRLDELPGAGVSVRLHRPDADLADQINAIFGETWLHPDDVLAGLALAIAVVVEETQCLAIDRVDQRIAHAGGTLLELIKRRMIPAGRLQPFAHLEQIAEQLALIVSGIKDRFKDVAI